MRKFKATITVTVSEAECDRYLKETEYKDIESAVRAEILGVNEEIRADDADGTQVELLAFEEVV